MLTYRDMQIGMEKVKDARRVDAQRRLAEEAQAGFTGEGPVMTALMALGGWLVREPDALRAEPVETLATGTE